MLGMENGMEWIRGWSWSWSWRLAAFYDVANQNGLGRSVSKGKKEKNWVALLLGSGSRRQDALRLRGRAGRVLRGQGACLRRGVGGGDRFTRFDRFVRALYIARAHTQREKRERNCMLADQGLRLDKVRPCSRGLPSQQEKQKSLLFLV